MVMPLSTQRDLSPEAVPGSLATEPVDVIGLPSAGDDGDVEVAQLDRDGVIVAVNQPWRAFCQDNDGDPQRTGVGVSYLAVCAADGGETADEVACAVRTALTGDLPSPIGIRIGCDSPEAPRWFDVLISSRFDDADGSCIGATVALSPAGAPRAGRAGGAKHEDEQPLTGSRPGVDAAGRSARIAEPPVEEVELSFPDAPRLELEELLGQLTERAQGVLAVQGRLRGLLRANAAIVGDLSLPVVLRQIVTAARELVHARHAALGVVGNGGLEQFVHVGLQPEEIEGIGDLPQGRGILGLLISDPRPVRIADLGTHPVSAGYPPGHPQMHSFLGVPIRVADQVFGTLYLTGSANGEFSEDDEQLVTALAATASVAISNARLYADVQQQRRWLAASTELTQQLLADPDGSPLELVLRYAEQGAMADAAGMAVVNDDGELHVRANAGRLAGPLDGQPLDPEATLAGRVVESGKPILISDYASQIGGHAVRSSPIGPAVGVPLLAGDRVLGALIVARAIGRPEFTETDRDQLAGFAGQASVGIQLARARADRELARLADDRDRIAADLHDHVIQELFALGMGLEGMINGLDRPEQQYRVSGYVDGLDAVIRRVRSTIFELHGGRLDSAAGVQHRLMAVLDEERQALGFAAAIEFSGPLSLAVPAALIEDIVAVVREGLSNAARHAQASAVNVSVALVGNLLSVEITDDGRGIGSPERSSGLSNLRRRAVNHGGTMTLSVPEGGGTRLRWAASVA